MTPGNGEVKKWGPRHYLWGAWPNYLEARRPLTMHDTPWLLQLCKANMCVCVIKCNTWIIYTMHPGLGCNEIEDNFAKAFQRWASVHIAKLHQLLVRAERTFVWMANIVFALSSISGEGYNVNDFTSWAIFGNHKNSVFNFSFRELV